MKQLQNQDKTSILQVKEGYINCVSLRNIVTYLKNVVPLTISTSASLQIDAEFICACDPVKGYLSLSNNSSQPSLRHPIDPVTFFSSV
jgi:hypothetical protein